MTTPTENPYQSPQTVGADPPSPGEPVQVDWKSILKRWEILRIPYNLIVGLAGLVALAMIPPQLLPYWPSAIAGVLFYAFCANVMYFLGPVAELYVNWFIDAWENQFVPKWMGEFVRSRYFTALMFIAGALFSVAVTLAIGFAEAFEATLPDQ